MKIFGYHRTGFDGLPIEVEVDVRPGGLPGIDLVGLPGNAVREAKDRVRSAVRNSGYPIPKGRILLNLTPAGIRKDGAGFDLSIALVLIGASVGWFSGSTEKKCMVMAMGELKLDGSVKGIHGVLPAAATARSSGMDLLLVPSENFQEAVSLGYGNVLGIDTLKEGVDAVQQVMKGELPALAIPESRSFLTDPGNEGSVGDFADVKGQAFLKRGMEIAAAGAHHCLVFGVPGTGKTMSALRLGGILPDLSPEEAVEVTKLYSIAGKLGPVPGLIRRPRTRSPHHSSSLQGILGGGPGLIPGEISLAHRGVLVLDEAPEFSHHVLQNLREPMERGEVHIARAGKSVWFPARFQLVMTANPCPCGNLGRKTAVCLCSQEDIARYWRRIGGALLDRIDIRIPVEAEGLEAHMGGKDETSEEIRRRVEAAGDFRLKVRGQTPRNGDLSSTRLTDYGRLNAEAHRLLSAARAKLDLSSRAIHSVLRVSRTIADLKQCREIDAESLAEAVVYRRYGDGNYMWNEP
ncbi:MAG: YifB family Mg chelatase-like AAA ATPase [Spirochaetales bacterium]|nr:YifB family Mg chelatase-like AAA ATPase [Spirochaetales bacterium]